MKNVNAWTEDVIIPTYETGVYEKNPVFLEKRVYQGSSGAVYPYPVIEKIYDEKINKSWKAVFIENDYLKIMILPELGGRIQMAYDKIKQRHFVYYNQVIKPALVGLTGPWISGGIEFNWPQHHRPTTYEPVDFTIEELSDGSITVWCSEIERMFRTKGMAGFTLYPDKAYLEIKVKLYNRTPVPQTFLWWANPAVKVNEHYQSVFPPDVHAVFDHGKRDVSSFPVATGTYYKVDYSAGVDISKYKNIPVPTSYMAIQSGYDFIGCYENDTRGGMLHVANHHISPGKKQWTWGNGDFGYAWDRNLTDEDGPYIELMCGVYTDNQPDFSWLMPCEEKCFSQYFMPYCEIGMVKNATKEACINVEISDKQIDLGIYTTDVYSPAVIEVWHNNELLFYQEQNLSPLNIFKKSINNITNLSSDGIKVSVKHQNKILIEWKPEPNTIKSIPEPAKAAKSPQEIVSNEQLYLTGLHLEQYRHATYRPEDYYQEALMRDNKDYRCNNALGLLAFKKGHFCDAGKYFQTAINTLTERNPNPIDGEPHYNLGLALRYQYNNDKAYDAFYKSIWTDAWQASGYFHLAQIDCTRKKFDEALELIEKSMIKQYHNHKARHLKCCLLRKTEKKAEALALIKESLHLDPFNVGCIFEKYLINDSPKILEQMTLLMRDNIHHYIEIALDYFWAGLFEESVQLLKTGIETQTGDVYPMAWYYLAWIYYWSGDHTQAATFFRKAEQEQPGICFPNQTESVLALSCCIQLLEKPDKAHYYLGNFYYHSRVYQSAIQNWESSAKINSSFPTVHRNLAQAYFNQTKNREKALAALEKSFLLDQNDSRIFMELDALYKRLNKDYGFRLEKLNNYPELTAFRDDVSLEKIALLNFTFKHDKAFDMLMKRQFHPWEGGEGKVTGQYVLSLTEWAKKDIQSGQYAEAIQKIEKAGNYPYNLGEGKLYGAQENDLFFWLGYCYEKLDQHEQSAEYYKKASSGTKNPSLALFYNDQQPDKIFYQGLALYKLNRKADAEERFNTLYEYGEKHLNDTLNMDYFAVSLPDMMIWEDDLNLRNKLHCNYLIALGKIGLGFFDEAEKLLDSILETNRYHEGAFIHSELIKSKLLMFLITNT